VLNRGMANGKMPVFTCEVMRPRRLSGPLSFAGCSWTHIREHFRIHPRIDEGGDQGMYRPNDLRMPGGKRHHEPPREVEDYRLAVRRPRVARPKRSNATGHSGGPPLRVVRAPGGLCVRRRWRQVGLPYPRELGFPRERPSRYPLPGTPFHALRWIKVGAGKRFGILTIRLPLLA
jgi:hypothetical protein